MTISATADAERIRRRHAAARSRQRAIAGVAHAYAGDRWIPVGAGPAITRVALVSGIIPTAVGER